MSATASDRSASMSSNYIVQAWLVLLLALFFGAALAGVQMTLGPTIAANKINETRAKVPELVLGAEAARKEPELTITPHTVGIDKNGRTTYYSVYDAVHPDGRRAGWVVKTSGQGYADKLDLLVGLNAEATQIRGLFVLEQKETPGLGAKITTDQWRAQFIGKDARTPLTVTKGDPSKAGDIQAVTGATISSRAVSGIINGAVGDLREKLAAGDLGGAE